MGRRELLLEQGVDQRAESKAANLSAGSSRYRSGGKGDSSWTNPTCVTWKQGESSSPGERSGMGTHGTSEPWGRIPRSVGLTRGTAVPTPRTSDEVERSVCQFTLTHPDGPHRTRSNDAAAGGRELASCGPGGG
jgi:hypothetical protein